MVANIWFLKFQVKKIQTSNIARAHKPTSMSSFAFSFEQFADIGFRKCYLQIFFKHIFVHTSDIPC